MTVYDFVRKLLIKLKHSNEEIGTKCNKRDSGNQLRREEEDILNIKGLDPDFTNNEVSDYALAISKSIRGIERKPAIFLYGVMPRCGSVYTGELLRLHPDISAYPNNLWEVPFLEHVEDIIHFQKNFIQAYHQNEGRIHHNDFLPLVGASFIAYLHGFVPEGKRILIKRPVVKYLNYFFSVFPHENLLLLMRDGRDVVSSTIKTWSQSNFLDVCKLWNNSAKMMMAVHGICSQKGNGCLYVKYEDVIDDPVTLVKNMCRCFDLDPSKYPFAQISNIPVRGSSSIKKNGKTTWDPVSKPEDFKTVGHWKEWSEDMKNNFKQISGQTLIEAGYCKSFDW